MYPARFPNRPPAPCGRSRPASECTHAMSKTNFFVVIGLLLLAAVAIAPDAHAKSP